MRIGSAAALALVLAACSGSNDNAHEQNGGDAHASAEGHGVSVGPADAHAAEHTSAAAHAAPAHNDPAHWSYANQAAWSAIAGACGAGQEQSPVNLSSASPISDIADLSTRYIPVDGAFVNNGHTLQFNPAHTASVLMLGSHAFPFAQFHFHAPAEHTLDGRAYPVELHFVHRNQAGDLAVVGVFITEGAENPVLTSLLAGIPNAAGEDHATHLDHVDLSALLPPDRTYFGYAGSLTTPPCSERVRWHVLATPITASPSQVAALREALGASSRHTQPLNARTVLLGS